MFAHQSTSPPAVRSGSRRNKAWFVQSALAVFIVLVFVWSMDTGVIHLSPVDLARTMLGSGSSKDNLILFDFRLPRIVICVLAGAGLAVSGCILQGITRNPLSDPGILGINAGAGLVVVLCITVLPNLEGSFLLPMFAFVGAGLTAALIYLCTWKRGEGLRPTRLVLVGIAIAAAINAIMMILELTLDPQNFQFVATWLAGSIMGTDWQYVVALLPWIVVLIPFVIFKARTLNVLNLGDSLAIGLGVAMERERLILLGCSVALAGACVAALGSILSLIHI